MHQDNYIQRINQQMKLNTPIFQNEKVFRKEATSNQDNHPVQQVENHKTKWDSKS